MTTQYVSYNSYYGHECRWGDSTSSTAVSIAPSLYRWDAYDVYASASYSERLRYEPNGSEGNWSFSKAASSSGGYSYLDSFGTRTYQRKETAYNIELRLGYTAGSSWGGSYHNVSGYATFTLTVPALQSWAVTFNANGGTGAPSQQTKYYGKTLVLSSTVPVKENYNFLGWATSDSATTPNYQPGASYTGNAALALYAVWELAVVPPTASVAAYRVASSGSTTETGDGAYVYARCDWTQGDNAVTGVTAAYTIDGSTYSATVSGTTSGASGIAQTWFALPTSDNASIAFTVTDGQASVNKSATVSSVNFPIYVHDKDKTEIYDLTVDTNLVASGYDLVNVEHIEINSDGVDLYKIGRMCVLDFAITVNLSSSWLTVSVGTLAAGYRPSHLVWGTAMADNKGGLVAAISANTDGAVSVSNRGGTSIGNQTVHGQLVYFV